MLDWKTGIAILLVLAVMAAHAATIVLGI